jgi:hypothetical protein
MRPGLLAARRRRISVLASVLLTLRRTGQTEFMNIVTACVRNGKSGRA